MPVNTAALKTFAPAMRRQLIEAVGRKLDLLLHQTSADTLTTAAGSIEELRQQEAHNRQQLLERVAYSWFNRLAALADAEMERPREDLRSIWARVEEKACRLALIYACSKNREKPVIDADAAEWACGLSEHLTRRVLYLAHEYVSQGEFDAKQKAVLRAMRTAGGRMTRSQMCRVTQHLTQRERDEVLENLKETGRLKEGVEPTAGRSRRVYELLP